MPYKYDAFFSYKRHPESDAWHQTLKEKLEFWLRMELNQPQVEIFFDTEDIKSGDRWKQKLEVALKSSKCLVCIWSPLYFKSKWCVSEWTTFEARGKGFGLDLVIPARYHDGNHFPQSAQDRQSRDFSSYASTMPRFWDTELAVEFDLNQLKPFAENLAEKVGAAPPFDPEFPLVEATDDLILQDTQIDRISDD